MTNTPDLATVTENLIQAMSGFLPIDPHATLDEMINAVHNASADVNLDAETKARLDDAVLQALNFLTSQPSWNDGATMSPQGIAANQATGDLHDAINSLPRPAQADCD